MNPCWGWGWPQTTDGRPLHHHAQLYNPPCAVPSRLLDPGPLSTAFYLNTELFFKCLSGFAVLTLCCITTHLLVLLDSFLHVYFSSQPDNQDSHKGQSMALSQPCLRKRSTPFTMGIFKEYRHMECFSINSADAAFVSSCFNNLGSVLVKIPCSSVLTCLLFCPTWIWVFSLSLIFQQFDYETSYWFALFYLGLVETLDLLADTSHQIWKN